PLQFCHFTILLFYYFTISVIQLNKTLCKGGHLPKTNVTLSLSLSLCLSLSLSLSLKSFFK
ncbi:MAG: hypothetical protein J8272_01105, partial ['Prunus persica' phytoplasma PP2]|nr:hypothetical protein ['Prunus persica' phytoplasma PP2]